MKTAVVAVERRLARLEPGARQREDPHAGPRLTSAELAETKELARKLDEMEKQFDLQMQESLARYGYLTKSRVDQPQEGDDGTEGEP